MNYTLDFVIHPKFSDRDGKLGKRINSAADDAAGLAVANKMTSQMLGMRTAIRNTQDGISLVQTAESSMNEINNMILRMRELAVQSANGTLTDGDRAHTDAEFDQLVAEVTRIANNTTWAGKKLINGDHASTALSFQIGEGANQTIDVNIADMKATALGAETVSNGTDIPALSAAGLDSLTNAQLAIQSIDNAIDSVSTARGGMGAVSNRLSSTMSNLDQIAINLSASQGRIQDADFAQETGNLAKNQILQQAATAMIAQANASKSSVLTLVRG